MQVLSSWSMLGGWSGNKLLIHDSFLLICILWALHNKADISPGTYWSSLQYVQYSRSFNKLITFKDNRSLEHINNLPKIWMKMVTRALCHCPYINYPSQFYLCNSNFWRLLICSKDMISLHMCKNKVEVEKCLRFLWMRPEKIVVVLIPYFVISTYM